MFQTDPRGVEAVMADIRIEHTDGFRRTLVGLKLGTVWSHVDSVVRFRRTLVGLKLNYGVDKPRAQTGFRRTLVGLKQDVENV